MGDLSAVLSAVEAVGRVQSDGEYADGEAAAKAATKAAQVLFLGILGNHCVML